MTEENLGSEGWITGRHKIDPDDLGKFTGEVIYRRWAFYGRPDLVSPWPNLPEHEQVRWNALARWAETVNQPTIDVEAKYGDHLRKINPVPFDESVYSDDAVHEEAAQFADMERARFA